MGAESKPLHILHPFTLFTRFTPFVLPYSVLSRSPANLKSEICDLKFLPSCPFHVKRRLGPGG